MRKDKLKSKLQVRDYADQTEKKKKKKEYSKSSTTTLLNVKRKQ
jgi:hypothetical protein